MDIAEFFKAGFKNLQKDLINKNYRKKSLQGRKESLINARRQTRDTLRFNFRKIDPNHIMSPCTPIVSKSKTNEIIKNKEEPINKEVGNNKRLEMLKQWKEKKMKLKQQEKKNAKPVFKVFHVEQRIGLPDLERVNKEIKGKPMKPLKTELPKSFAPANYKFTAPKQVQPIHFNKPLSLDKPGTSTVSNSKKNVHAVTRSATAVNLKKEKLSNKNITNNAKKTLPNPSTSIKEVQPSTKTISNIKKNVNVAVTRTNTRSATAANLKKQNLASKKPVKLKILEEPNTAKGQLKTKESKFKTPENKVNTPKDEHQAKSLTFKTPESQFKTQKNEYQTKSLSKRDVTPWLKKNEGSNSFLSGENDKNEESVIIIDDSLDDLIVYADSEVTMKTPVKKRTSSRISRYTPRPPSARKSYAKKDSCILCLDSPLKNKTPTTKTKTPPTKTKTPPTKTKTPTTKTKTPTTKTKTPTTKTKTRKSKSNSNKNDMASTVSSNIEEFTDNINKTVYDSPFVTKTRGKGNKTRKSTGETFTNIGDGKDFNDVTSPEYFERILNNEISRIESACEKWENYKIGNEISEETSDMINVAIGMSRLLISKKFKQFRGLIDQCTFCTFEEKPITCEDLHGFWDMMYHQVLDLDKRFDNLEKLKDNNWEEIIPKKRVIKKKVRGQPNKPAATSSVKEFIKAVKIKNKQQDSSQSVIKEPKTPENAKIASPIKGNSSRKSLRVSVLKEPTLRRVSSPGLTMMKITQSIKAGDGLTPSKSILKTDLTKSAKRHTKSVLFFTNVLKKAIFSPEDKENSLTQANVNNSDEVLIKVPMSLRRSKRHTQN